MGASLLVFANKTDVGGCMTDDEIKKVEDQYSNRTLGRWTVDISRDCNWMQSRHTNGPSSGAAQSQGNICRQVWHGWFRTQKTDCSCTERLAGAGTTGKSPGADRLALGGALTRGKASKQLRVTTNRPGGSQIASDKRFDRILYYCYSVSPFFFG